MYSYYSAQDAVTGLNYFQVHSVLVYEHLPFNEFRIYFLVLFTGLAVNSECHKTETVITHL